MLENITNSLAIQALNVLWDFNSAISNNIANVNTENYSPIKVDFAKMYDVLSSNSDNPGAVASARKSNAEDLMYVDTENTVKIEKEMMNLTKNAVLYQAILGARNEYSDLLSIAIKGGK